MQPQQRKRGEATGVERRMTGEAIGGGMGVMGTIAYPTKEIEKHA